MALGTQPAGKLLDFEQYIEHQVERTVLGGHLRDATRRHLDHAISDAVQLRRPSGCRDRRWVDIDRDQRPGAQHQRGDAQHSRSGADVQHPRHMHAQRIVEATIGEERRDQHGVDQRQRANDVEVTNDRRTLHAESGERIPET